jgi:hypothetical protein
VLVAGSTSGTLEGQTSAGGGDAFVRKYDASGAVLWTQQFGSASSDAAHSVAVDGAGNVLVAGSTGGTLEGQTSAGDYDAFVRKFDSSGALLVTRQFGSASVDNASSVAVDGSGNALVAGRTGGTFAGQTNAGGMDAFVTRLRL